ncbi:hypothetical protein ACIGBH_09555 [Streptomyces sp. NPDC085929]|uniref:hypothetical protein n=1 Tax=Streptomyces sp. NPDC085929 TaxID=3365739 RepID=UPI0037CDBC59
MIGFAALSAVILNKAMSLAVVITAPPARLAAVSFGGPPGRAFLRVGARGGGTERP